MNHLLVYRKNGSMEMLEKEFTTYQNLSQFRDNNDVIIYHVLEKQGFSWEDSE